MYIGYLINMKNQDPMKHFFSPKQSRIASLRERKGEASRLRREEVLPFYCPIERVLEANMINGSICMSFHRFQNGNSVCMQCYAYATYLLFPRRLTKSIESYCSKFCRYSTQITNKFLHMCFCNQNDVCLFNYKIVVLFSLQIIRKMWFSIFDKVRQIGCYSN